METEESKVKKIYKNNRTIIFFTILLIVVFLIFIGYKYVFKSQKNYVVEEGHINISSNLLGYFIKDEKIIETDKTKSIVSIAEQGRRVAKGEIIAIYKNEKYDDYINKINQKDKEISEALKQLNPVYSNDISVIDNQIEELLRNVKDNTSSYISITESKNRLNELAYKRNLIVSELSPNGAVVKDLIKQRDQISEDSKKASDNIVATSSGLVTYKIDGLEDKYSATKVLNYNIDDLKRISESFEKNTISQTGIKIVNNYISYLYLKEKRGNNDTYIAKDKSYNIKINDKNVNVIGKIVKLEKDDNYNYCVFEITNGVEYLVDTRTISTEITWKEITGMIVPKNSIKEDQIGKYVTVIKNGEYIKIYINIAISSDNMCIVKNIDVSKDLLSIYDRVVI
jgi:putative membrane fusion protein